MIQTQVLIVGGSLNGLTTALLLAHHDVPCTLVERHSDTTVQYKFAGISPRSMEIYRSLGIEEDIRQHRTGDQKSGEIVRAPNLSSPDVVFQGKPWAATAELSAASAETCDQDRLEPILRRHAEKLGADVRFHTELLGFEQVGDKVRARVRDVKTGGEDEISAKYLIACDGAGGKSLERLGLKRNGPGVLQYWMNLIFDSDLEPIIQGKKFTSCFVTDINASIVPRGRRWLLAIQYSPERGEKPEHFDAAKTRELVCKAAGQNNVRADLYDARSWEVAAYTAERFVKGRCFLLGDAAHSMPPTGGFGGNTGIHDAHNLAWKLALVLKGTAGPALLDTYDTERRPLAELTLAQALARLAAWFKDLGKQLPPAVPIVDDMNVIFGQRYGAGAFITASEKTNNPLDDGLGDMRTRNSSTTHQVPFDDAHNPSGEPGTRAAHMTLQHEGKRVAIHDLIGKGFLLLTSADAASMPAAVAKLARESELDIRCVCIKPADSEALARFQTAYHANTGDTVLIRPDGFIAWRSKGTVTDVEQRLKAVLQRILSTVSN